MPSYQTPGVYVEEVEGGSKPIEAGATNIVGFLGVAEKGPVNEAVLVTNWTQYTKIFGGMHTGGWLGHAVYQFFQNGGTKAYINNLAEPSKKTKAKNDEQPAEAKAESETVEIKNPDNIAKLIIGKDEGVGKKTGLYLFDQIQDIAIVAAPGVTDPAAQDAILSHCEKNRFRFAVLDSPETLAAGIDTMPKPRDSMMGAYYFPWISMYDAVQDKNVYAPPSGGICGIYGRVDGTRGVHKAPANEIFRTALGLKYNLTDAEQELLNPKGINCIRDFPGRGIRVWGARTCSSNTLWKYVNVRRLFIYLEESIKANTSWAVFEPNDTFLWTRVNSTISSFLRDMWRAGALVGESEAQAYFVNVGRDTMSQNDILNGRLICEIGVAPSRPAEFVIFRITQMMEEE